MSAPAAQTARRFVAALRMGRPSIGWDPQCLVLGGLPSSTIERLCEAIEALNTRPDLAEPVQFAAEITRCAKRHGAKNPALHVRLTNAIAALGGEPDESVRVAAAALILAVVP